MSDYLKFCELLSEWDLATGAMSSPLSISVHPQKQKILDLKLPDKVLISYLLLNLHRYSHTCGILLYELVPWSKQPQIPEYYAGRVPVVVECWFYWGLEEGYIKTCYNPNKYWTKSCFDDKAISDSPQKNNERFFSNKDCKHFPCHKDVDINNFSCLFCFCPLYLYDCKGNFKTVNNKKDCSNCVLPHTSYDFVIDFLKKIGV
ncbi:MAG: cysteine-rich small domain-containing protein [Methanogenium sp.]|jgi:hypothetical protein